MRWADGSWRERAVGMSMPVVSRRLLASVMVLALHGVAVAHESAAPPAAADDADAAAGPQPSSSKVDTGLSGQRWPEGRWPDIDAVVSYRMTSRSRSGVRRTDEWSERFVRRARTLWIERIVPSDDHDAGRDGPSGAEHVHADASGHDHLDAERAARWLFVDRDGSQQFRLVDHDGRAVVTVPPAEYGTVSFDGRIDAMASLVPPSSVTAMQPDGPPGKDGRWYAGTAAGWRHRVLWSAALKMALIVESASIDGQSSRTVRVRPGSRPEQGAEPWRRLGDYTERRYDEYMD